MQGQEGKADKPTTDDLTEVLRGATLSIDRTDKAQVGQAYDSYHERLRSTPFGNESFYMNLGYVANENQQYSTI